MRSVPPRLGFSAVPPPATETTLAAHIERLRRELASGRERVRALHQSGTSGRPVAAALCDVYDCVIAGCYRDALELATPSDRPTILRELALVAVGGYGRGDPAPFSDVDLLFLVHPTESAPVHPFVSQLVRDLWDIGLKLSQSVRTPAGCVAMSRQDLPARTALGETRLLAGSDLLYTELQHDLHQVLASSPADRFLADVLAERAREHDDYFAPTVCLLEPNIKKSPGGLRDLHLLRWIALARYGTRDPEMLRLGGLLSDADAEALDAAADFLLRIRNELHFHAGSAQDVLTREEQVRLARWLGFEAPGPLLPVERFMQHYYRQTGALNDLVLRFVDRARGTSKLRQALGRLTIRREGDFHINRERVRIDPAARPAVLDDAGRLLQLFDLARTHGVAVGQDDFELARTAAAECEVTPAARAAFLHLLAEPAGLGDLLRALHRIGLLERLVPAFGHARCLIQFNQAHKYTVDEHSIRAVEGAARRSGDAGPVGQAYVQIRRKDLLHLALLCHDLGKGLGEDHCAAGRRIADQTARLFDLHARDRELFVFLVHQHLLMAHTAFRRDISDEKTLLQFAQAVGTPEVLHMLYVLTAADTEAVAPGNWTPWKESLLTELYRQALEELAGESPLPEADSRDNSLRERLVDELHIRFPLQWLEAQLALMPRGYLRGTDSPHMVGHLRMLRDLKPGDALVESEYVAETHLTRFTVVAREELAPGIFSKLAGVLAASRVEIITARIVTRPDGTLIDTFEGIDRDFTGEPPRARLEEIAERMREVLTGRRAVESLFRGASRSIDRGAPLHPAPTRVEIDAHSSDRFTIVEVFAHDRPGLLYDLARTLYQMELSVYSARISTHLDQVVDAFYVSTRGGEKVVDEAAHDVIRARLLRVLCENG